jgi:hypothetical protein
MIIWFFAQPEIDKMGLPVLREWCTHFSVSMPLHVFLLSPSRISGEEA